MKPKKGYKQLMAEASERVLTRPAEEAIAVLGNPDYAFIDIRDRNELEDEGMIPGAFHSPRGTLEFWIDPESPSYAPIYGDESKHLILYCGGSWRSVLAVAMLADQGFTNVSQIEGGFGGWKRAGGPVALFVKPEK